jgi:hypothetical protein
MTGGHRQEWRRVLSGVVATMAALAIVFAAPQVGPTIGLYDAIRDGKVRVTMRGTGGSTGPSVLIDASKEPNAGPGDIHVTVPPGTILRNGNGAGQNMVVAGVLGRFMGNVGDSVSISPSTDIVVSSVTPVAYVLAAYCTQFEKDNPSGSDQFTLASPGPDPTLAAILGQSRSLSDNAIQAAVWMQTDHVTFNHMNEKFPVSREDWSTAQTAFQNALNGAVAVPLPFRPSQAVGLPPLLTTPQNQRQGIGDGESRSTVSDLVAGLNGYWEAEWSQDGRYPNDNKPYHMDAHADLSVSVVDATAGVLAARFNHHQTLTDNPGSRSQRVWSKDYRVEIELVVGQIGQSISSRVIAAERRIDGGSSVPLPATVVRQFAFDDRGATGPGIERGLRLDIRYDDGEWASVPLGRFHGQTQQAATPSIARLTLFHFHSLLNTPGGDIGVLLVSPGRVVWTETGPDAHIDHDFQVSCSDIKEVGNNVFTKPGEHIQTRSGNYNFVRAVEIRGKEMAENGRIPGFEEALSVACPGVVK